MTKNLTTEDRRRGGKRRWDNHCTGCGDPLLPGEDCAFCEQFEAVLGDAD